MNLYDVHKDNQLPCQDWDESFIEANILSNRQKSLFSPLKIVIKRLGLTPPTVSFTVGGF